ncbi:excisionase [Janibacter hoylei PVAS-1]|uniref:Excisionase n=1 Tax=Janibacter hoylei PVAS-1 TaxID=1210046 RepID=K1E0K9_9MICO|nr:excisionase [Janibacter hoylei PVAS-1]
MQDVATFLGVPVGALYDWRCQGEGPPALKIGRRLRYRESDVFAWLDEQTAA